MHTHLKQNGVPTCLIEFEGESHGFRKHDNIKRAIEGELMLFGQIFRFIPAGSEQMAPVEIDNFTGNDNK